MMSLLQLWALSSVALLFFVIGNGRQGGALVLAYFAGLSLIHVPGAWIYTGTHNGLQYRAETEAGFAVTVMGLFAFVAGAWLARRRGIINGTKQKQLSPADYSELSKTMLGLGMAFYFFLGPLLAFIPSFTALVSPLGGLLLIGFWIWFYGARISHDQRRFWMGLALLPLMPLSTMMTGGFIGYGVYWIIAVVAFIYCIYPRKRMFVLVSPVILYFGLSFATAYFMERGALREAVWYNQTDLGGRMGTVVKMVERFEWLDLANDQHVLPIDRRLNQNILVGQAIIRREHGQTRPAHGATVPLWIFIPRLLWPDKPAVGGSGQVVADFTGQIFAEGTSVGIGQPLEFYINFDEPGIVVGFAILGYVLMRLDRSLFIGLKRGDVQAVLRSGLMGIALLQPGGSLMEMLVALVGTWVVAPVVGRWLQQSAWLNRVSTTDRPQRIKGVTLEGKS